MAGNLPNKAAVYIPRRRKLEDVVTHYEDEDMPLQYPALYALLCHARVDGHYRAGARLTLFADAGRLKVSVWDPDSGQVWFATLEAFSGALEATERLLSEGRGEWREKRETGRR